MSPKSSSEDKNALASSVYEQLKGRIMYQSFKPEARLNIDALALDLVVSPTPVREALARLAAERLVTFEPFKGYSVNPLLSPRQVADLMHVRRLIEIDAVRLACVRFTRSDSMALEKLLAESKARSLIPGPQATAASACSTRNSTNPLSLPPITPSCLTATAP
jgi:DNA-binding GntR family transcriptional regulator